MGFAACAAEGLRGAAVLLSLEKKEKIAVATQKTAEAASKDREDRRSGCSWWRSRLSAAGRASSLPEASGWPQSEVL